MGSPPEAVWRKGVAAQNSRTTVLSPYRSAWSCVLRNKVDVSLMQVTVIPLCGSYGIRSRRLRTSHDLARSHPWWFISVPCKRRVTTSFSPSAGEGD